MTPAEAKAQADRANSIVWAHDALVKKRDKLEFAKKWVKEKNVWTPTLKLGEAYYGRDLTIEVTIPAAWIIQKALDEVKAAERAYILAGGTL